MLFLTATLRSGQHHPSSTEHGVSCVAFVHTCCPCHVLSPINSAHPLDAGSSGAQPSLLHHQRDRPAQQQNKEQEGPSAGGYSTRLANILRTTGTLDNVHAPQAPPHCTLTQAWHAGVVICHVFHVLLTSLHRKHCSQDSSSQAPGPHQHHTSWLTSHGNNSGHTNTAVHKTDTLPLPAKRQAAHSQPFQYASHAAACSPQVLWRAATDTLLAMHAPLRQVKAPMADDRTGSMDLHAIKYRGTHALPKPPTNPALRTWSGVTGLDVGARFPAPVGEQQGALLGCYAAGIARHRTPTYKHKQGHRPHNKHINTQPHPAGWPCPQGPSA